MESKFFDQPFLRNRILKIRHFIKKIFWAPKNIWRTLEDVKLNFGQLSFSTPSPFFCSLRSYWALKCLENIWPKIFCPKILLFKTSITSQGVEKWTWCRKRKLSEIQFYIFSGPPNIFWGSKYFFIEMPHFQNAISQKGLIKKFWFQWEMVTLTCL